MQRGEVLRRHAFEKSCSRVTFPNTWGATVFVVLHLAALALCFSMSRGRPFHVFKLCFSILAKTRHSWALLAALGALLGRSWRLLGAVGASQGGPAPLHDWFLSYFVPCGSLPGSSFDNSRLSLYVSIHGVDKLVCASSGVFSSRVLGFSSGVFSYGA